MNNLFSTYVYHVNSLKNIHRIINSFNTVNPRLYVAKEDGYWAGSGMYFWDNIGNANYWLNKSKKDKPRILRARLSYNSIEILDLSDIAVLNKFNDRWPKIAQLFEVEEHVSLGKKINTIVEFMTELKVVKEIGFYPKIKYTDAVEDYSAKEHDFLEVPDNINGPHVTARAKTIYCVNDPRMLSSLEIME